MNASRSPVVGYNHNTAHLGWDFHLQTEDSGAESPHIITHLFHDGTILATKKLVYDPSSSSEFVKDLMGAQHKAVLRELKAGRYDEKIVAFLGEPTRAGASAPVDTRPAEEPSLPPNTNPAAAVVVEGTPLEWTVPPSVPASWSNPSLPPMLPTPPSLSSPPPSDGTGSWVMRSKIKETVFEDRPDAPRSDPAHTSLRPAPARVVREGGVIALCAEFVDGAAFLQSYFPNGAAGGVLVEVNDGELPLGTALTLRVRVGPSNETEFQLKARVAWKRTRGSSLGAGLGVELLSSEKSVLNRLMAVVNNPPGSATDRKFRRVSASIKVKLKEANGEARKENAADISEGGIFVTTSRMIDVGREVTLTLKPPGALLRTLDVRGKVTWLKGEGHRGLGVMFLFDSDEQREKIRDLVARLRHAASR